MRGTWRLRVSETERKSTVGWVKFKTVAEIRRNSARDTFTAESAYRGWKRSMMMIPGFAVIIGFNGDDTWFCRNHREFNGDDTWFCRNHRV